MPAVSLSIMAGRSLCWGRYQTLWSLERLHDGWFLSGWRLVSWSLSSVELSGEREDKIAAAKRPSIMTPQHLHLMAPLPTLMAGFPKDYYAIHKVEKCLTGVGGCLSARPTRNTKELRAIKGEVSWVLRRGFLRSADHSLPAAILGMKRETGSRHGISSRF